MPGAPEPPGFPCGSPRSAAVRDRHLPE
jgi:hypothetical protein